MEVWRSRSKRVTYVLLVTSAVLIAPGLAGFGATPVLAGLLAVVAGVLWGIRDQMGQLPTVVGYDLSLYARDSWIGCLLAVLVVLFYFDASAPELQALGGIVGLIGMLNYFLRPLYLFVVGYLRKLTRGT